MQPRFEVRETIQMGITRVQAGVISEILLWYTSLVNPPKQLSAEDFDILQAMATQLQAVANSELP